MWSNDSIIKPAVFRRNGAVSRSTPMLRAPAVCTSPSGRAPPRVLADWLRSPLSAYASSTEMPTDRR